jgi:SAM-dependent methyltransferase
MPRSFDHRHREEEWMDRPDVDPSDLRRSLAFIQQVNRFFGYSRAMVGHLERFSRNWKSGERIEIVDLATGSADIPRAILRWAGARGFDVHIVGLDLHDETLKSAGEQSSDPRLTLVRGDALNPPFEKRSFDYALTAMFLHHLDDEPAVRVMTNLNWLARRGVVAADLLRHRRAYVWIRLLTLPLNSMVRHDAAVSVAQAFSKEEVLRMQLLAGLDFTTYYRHFGYRWTLAGERVNPVDE